MPLAGAELTIDPAVAALATACMALLFGAAAFHKLRHLRQFEAVFAAYELLPPAVRPAVSRLVPLVEAAVAAGVLLEAARAAAVGAGMLLLLVYAAAIAINLRRGRRDLACGCGGADERRPIAPWMIGRNLCLATLCALVLLPRSGRPLELTDALTIGCGTLTLALIYLCIDRLLTATGSPGLRRT